MGGKQNGEDFIMGDRVVTGEKRVLMDRVETRRPVYNTKCSHSKRNAYVREFTAGIAFCERIHTGRDCR